MGEAASGMSDGDRGRGLGRGSMVMILTALPATAGTISFGDSEAGWSGVERLPRACEWNVQYNPGGNRKSLGFECALNGMLI